MSRRKSIANALVDKLKLIDGSAGYQSNVFGNVFPKLVYWDQCSDFPSIFIVTGQETREYLPCDFVWGYLNISIKVYVRGEDPQQVLEDLLEDVENVIDANRQLTYDAGNSLATTDIDITSIITDEGLLDPYGVGEINVLVRYQVI